jgi:hypothetical protein
MKPSIILSALLMFVLLGCKDKEKIVEPVDEKPDDIFNIPLCETLNSSVMELFTESRNNEEMYPELFSNATQEKVVVTKESDVYISYVAEGASVPSTLGYYTYTGSAPTSADGIDKKIIFPNVSNAILTPGDSRYIGKFPAGTTIQFFLIVGGFQTATSTVNYSKPTFYTNYALNPGGHRQHVLFRETKCNNILMGFEDKAIETGSDHDFNDIIFVISDNDSNQASTSFDQSTMVGME